MKSQGSEFPFKTHPRAMNAAITSLLFYGLASATEHFISATPLGPASVNGIVAHSGRIASFLEALGDLEIDPTTSTKAMTAWFSLKFTNYGLVQDMFLLRAA
ncbi:hypothetical protein L2E82_47681 [Cichorium intybus]|uniref:Uncharacterized protein n=1 Tax=Cichorium intybus TaxID=13427 RepID=A0ACB8YXE0_CICIN|nr:hypothetical protein L2E82_47681 [Cichorium intybus]